MSHHSGHRDISLIPLSLRDLLSKLEFIAMTERGKKLCLNDMAFVDSKSWVGAYKRSVAGEGRKNMVFQVNTIIDDAVRAMVEYKDTEFFPLIINTLARAKTGILNLCSTYHHRPDTVSKLQVCLMNIQLQLDKYKHLLQGHHIGTGPVAIPQTIGPDAFGISPVEPFH